MEVKTTTYCGDIKNRGGVYGLILASQGGVWLRLLLNDMGCTLEGPTMDYQDNQGCIALAKNPILHARTKHVKIKYHFSSEIVEEGVIILENKPTNEMIADGLTKALGRVKHESFVFDLCLAA